MNKGKVYPELINYNFQYCEKYFLPEEIAAYRHFWALSYSENKKNEQVYQSHMRGESIEGNMAAQKLVKEGYQALRYKVTRRLLYECKNELDLNLCPVCGKIARTPQARQCRFCFHDWH